MIKATIVSAALSLLASLPLLANAGTLALSFNGPGVSSWLELTYGAATDAKYPQGFEVTGISGTYSDSNNGLDIVNATIQSLVPVTRETPNPGDSLAPSNFSRFAVASGLPPFTNGFITYDNLVYPAGSPQTGDVLDSYGLLFDIGDARVVALWNNAGVSVTGGGDYSVVVATRDTFLSYAEGSLVVAALPEPSGLALALAGLVLAGVGVRARGGHQGRWARRDCTDARARDAA